MAHPSSHSPPPLSTPSSSSRPPSTNSTIENDGASSAVILGDCRQTGFGGKRNSNRAISLRVLLVATTLVSTCVVVLASGVFRPASYRNGGITTIHDAPLLLRRGHSEAKVPITADTAGPPVALFRRTPGLTSRNLEESVLGGNSTNAALCDLEYCQTAFAEETLCPGEVEETNSIASIPVVVQVLILLILLSFSALFSGLTLGLMSLDITGLEIVMAGDDPDSARYASIIYPLRKQGNLLLCTLLLGNVAVNSLMAIFTAAIFNGTVGFLFSTFLIVIFGEIIPQALVRIVDSVLCVNELRICWCFALAPHINSMHLLRKSIFANLTFPMPLLFVLLLIDFVIPIIISMTVFSICPSNWKRLRSDGKGHQVVVLHSFLAVSKGLGSRTRAGIGNDL